MIGIVTGLGQAPAARAQSPSPPAPTPKFDVASIKPRHYLRQHPDHGECRLRRTRHSASEQSGWPYARG
jgi:hypothetical protein